MAHPTGHPSSRAPRGAGTPARAGAVAWRRWPAVLWRFGRPHTILGTSLSIAGLYAMLLAEQPAGPLANHLPWLALTWLSAIGANLFIVGLNQVTDEAIDRVNKPQLPIPSGDLSAGAARRIVAAAAALGLVTGVLVDRALLATVAASMAIGLAYSLPPLRLKRFAVWAALSIALVRGPLVNVGVYAALSARLFGPTPVAVPAQVWALAAFVGLFSLGIAVAKDVPDVAGDRRFAIGSLAVRAGPAVAFLVARLLLSAAYVGVCALAVLGLPGVNGRVLVAGHLALLAVLWLGTARTRPTDGAAVVAAYALIWRLFYAEYVLFPMACVLA
jgi:homogentisate phytyltransferase / homogentisate geranylgeranyltransferase